MTNAKEIIVSFNVVYSRRIDLPADQDLYSTRTDSIHTAIHIRLNTHPKTGEGAVARRTTSLDELDFTGE